MKTQRKKWIINKTFQYKFISLSIFPVIATVLSFLVGVEVIFYIMIEKGRTMNLPAGHFYYDLLNGQKELFLISSVVCGALVAVIFGIWAIIQSNKIAGPLYRLTNYLKGLHGENIKTHPLLKFRDKDYFLDVADEINKFIKRL